MKKALKIGAVAIGAYGLINLGFIVGATYPIVISLLDEDYDRANAVGDVWFDWFKKTDVPTYANWVQETAMDITNCILKMNKKDCRIVYDK